MQNTSLDPKSKLTLASAEMRIGAQKSHSLHLLRLMLRAGPHVASLFQFLTASPSLNSFYYRTKVTQVMSKYFKGDQGARTTRSKRNPLAKGNKDEKEQNDLSDEKEKVKWEPEKWQEQLENIRKMRINEDAPVDTMGCEKSWEVDAPVKIKRFHVLVSLMLSSQTKDEINNAAMGRLSARGLSPEMILNIDEGELQELIKPVGFWRRKTEYLKRVAKILIDKYEGDIPPNFTELCELPGVGPKMAHLVMQVAWKETTGIAVDTHVHRIANRLKWVKKTTTDPIVTERELEDWVPRCLWNEINHLLVGFGQTICKPVGPKCQECLNRNICPSSSGKSRSRKAKSNDQV